MKIYLSNHIYHNEFKQELFNAVNNLKNFYLDKKQILIEDKDILFTIEESYDGMVPVVYVPSSILEKFKNESI
jgi:hypothetical protein